MKLALDAGECSHIGSGMSWRAYQFTRPWSNQRYLTYGESINGCAVWAPERAKAKLGFVWFNLFSSEYLSDQSALDTNQRSPSLARSQLHAWKNESG